MRQIKDRGILPDTGEPGGTGDRPGTGGTGDSPPVPSPGSPRFPAVSRAGGADLNREDDSGCRTFRFFKGAGFDFSSRDRGNRDGCPHLSTKAISPGSRQDAMRLSSA